MATSAKHSPGRNPRVPWVDYAKGICIVLVVMMHATLGVGDAMGGTGFMHHVVEFARPFRMPDFFMISGLFLALVIDRDWRLYLDRKLVHFAYFYVLWLLIEGAFKWPSLAIHEGGVSVAEAFLIALVQPFSTLWFIYLLPVFFVAAKLLKNVSPWIILAFAAALEIAPIETGSILIDETAGRFFFFAFGWLAAPYVFAVAKAAAERVSGALLVLAVWAVVNGLLVHYGFSTLPVISLLLGLIGAFAVVIVAALLARFRIADFLRYAGERSLVVYLAFFIPMAGMRALLAHSGLSVGWVSVIVTAVAVIVPLLAYALMKKTGIGLFLFKRPAAFRIDRPRAKLQPAE